MEEVHRTIGSTELAGDLEEILRFEELGERWKLSFDGFVSGIGECGLGCCWD